MKPQTTAILRVVHLLSLSLWAGGAVFFSFGVAPKIFTVLQQDLPIRPPPGWHWLSSESGQRMAGEIVGAIFPRYFLWQLIAGMVALATGCPSAWRGRRPDRIRVVLILCAIVCALLQLIFVLPSSSALLDEVHHMQDLGDRMSADELRKLFGMWHGISQTLNLATILMVVAALALIGLEKADSQGSPVESLG